MDNKISLRRKRVEIAKLIKENLLNEKRDALLDSKLSLLKKQYAITLDMEEQFEN